VPRIALGISYIGARYLGWQSQSSGQTVQDKLEAALAAFSASAGRIVTNCAGRTDSGVHALQQVVHFDTPLQREPFSWVRGVNRFLPDDIAVQWAYEVPAEFHCRAQAQTRRYAYILLESPVRPSLDAGRVGWTFTPQGTSLSEPAMREAAQHLIGEHDFSSFRAAECQALSPIKTVHRIDMTRRGAYWRFDFEANAFLHHMIRNIMGCLLTIGAGHKSPQWMREVREAKSRVVAAPTFSPDGLYFLGPTYDERWQLPARNASFDSLPL
jgi:tRNA pseudouridine38-40 synthase